MEMKNKVFTHKTYQLLVIMAALFFNFSLRATKVVPCDDKELFIPTSTLAFIGTFLEERELFILARWHKNPNERI